METVQNDEKIESESMMPVFLQWLSELPAEELGCSFAEIEHEVIGFDFKQASEQFIMEIRDDIPEPMAAALTDGAQRFILALEVFKVNLFVNYL